MKYETIWRNKWITSEAKSIDDMIESYEFYLQHLRDMKADGLEFDFGGAGDDYIDIITDSSELAEKYHLHEAEEYLDEDDLDDEEDELETQD